MLLRLAVLGTIGYLGYREYQKGQAGRTAGIDAAVRPRQIALAGGPLSDQARIQSDPDAAPSASPASNSVN